MGAEGRKPDLREREETGLVLRSCTISDAFVYHESGGGINIIVEAEWDGGEAQLLEPNKCGGWEWRELDDIPKPVFATLERWLLRRRARSALGSA